MLRSVLSRPLWPVVGSVLRYSSSKRIAGKATVAMSSEEAISNCSSSSSRDWMGMVVVVFAEGFSPIEMVAIC